MWCRWINEKGLSGNVQHITSCHVNSNHTQWLGERLSVSSVLNLMIHTELMVDFPSPGAHNAIWQHKSHNPHNYSHLCEHAQNDISFEYHSHIPKSVVTSTLLKDHSILSCNLSTNYQSPNKVSCSYLGVLGICKLLYLAPPFCVISSFVCNVCWFGLIF